MVAFSAIKPGDTLYDCCKVRMGNTAMRRMQTWRVFVKEIDAERQRAMVVWNGNRPEWWSARRLGKLRRKPVETRKSVIA